MDAGQTLLSNRKKGSKTSLMTIEYQSALSAAPNFKGNFRSNGTIGTVAV